MLTTALYLLLAFTTFETSAVRQTPQTFEPRAYSEEVEATPDVQCFIIETSDGVTEVCQ